MQWKPEYSIGIASIDSQHQKIFQNLLAIENAITKRDPWEIKLFHLKQLEADLRFHLSLEEALLQVLHFPGFNSHRQSHAELENAVIELRNKIRNHAGSETDLVEFFNSWFVRHVLTEDREYASFISQRLAVFGPP